MPDTGFNGYQPSTRPAERRAFFDQRRVVQNLEERIVALEAALAALDTRVTDLETP